MIDERLSRTPLGPAMLAWLEESADIAVYAFADDGVAYCNDAFRRLFEPHEGVFAELASRSRKNGTAEGGEPAIRLPTQALQRPGREQTEMPLVAQEWRVRAAGRDIVVGCLPPPSDAAATERALLRLALHDGLTDLPNRSLFEDRLFQAIARARRNRRVAALLYLDLDGFKPINDRHGHHAGDFVLQTISGRMMAQVRETDTVARMGGDEFAVVLDDVRSPVEAEHTAARIIAAIAEPIELPDGIRAHVNGSIGVSVCPLNGSNPRMLIRAADEAMYASKRLGPGRYTLSTMLPEDSGDEKWMDDEDAEMLGVSDIDEQHAALVDLANRLYHAIERGDDEQEVLLDELVSFTQYHFASEEALMEEYGDPGAEAHKRQHAQLVGQVQFFRHALLHSGGQVVLSALRPWLIRHIKTFDRGLAAFVSRARERIEAEERLTD